MYFVIEYMFYPNQPVNQSLSHDATPTGRLDIGEC